MRARIVTLNIAGMKDGWFEGRRNVLIHALRARQPDILCVQETTLMRGSTAYDQAQDIGEAIGLGCVAFAPYGNPIEVMSPEQGGIAVISRWPFQRVRNRRLPAARETPPDARVALFVTVQTPQGMLKVVNTHFSWEPQSVQLRLMQMGLILDDLFKSPTLTPGVPLALAGDLNCVDTEPAIHLAGNCFIDAFRKRHPTAPGHTWVTSNPMTGRYPIADRRLDYIFCAPDAEVCSAEVILNRPAPTYASDHYGVLADLEWKKAASENEAA